MQVVPVRQSAIRLLALGAAATAVSLCGPAGASAAGCQGAPGTSALEQYCEAIPDATGGRSNPGDSSSGNGGSGSSGSGSSSSGSGSGVSQSTAKTLSGAGADGAAVSRLAGGSGAEKGSSKGSGDKSGSKDSGSGSAGSGGAAGGSGGSGGTGSGGVSAPAEPSGSPLKATTKAVAGGPTVGSEFVWGLLGMSAIGAVAAVLLRRRGASLVDEPGE